MILGRLGAPAKVALAAAGGAAMALAELGHPEEARRVLAEAEERFAGDADSLARLQLAAASAGIHLLEGQRPQAEELLRGVYRCILESDAYAGAGFALQLAAILAEEGRRDDVVELGKELAVVAGSGALHEQARAALVGFLGKLEEGVPPAGEVRALALYMARARRSPGVAFVWPGGVGERS